MSAATEDREKAADYADGDVLGILYGAARDGARVAGGDQSAAVQIG